MLSVRIADALVLLVTMALFSGLEGLPSASIIEIGDHKSECEGCGENCGGCRYGSAFSTWCGVRECLKGPGEMCGGNRNKYGACGEGMFCRCNKCNGCSTDTLECFSGFCPTYEHMLFRDPSHLQRLQ